MTQGSDGGGAYFNDYCNWGWIEEFKEFVFHSPAAALAARFMKSSQVSFYHEHVLNKEPGSSKRTPWHHDQSYYPIDGDQVGGRGTRDGGTIGVGGEKRDWGGAACTYKTHGLKGSEEDNLSVLKD